MKIKKQDNHPKTAALFARVSTSEQEAHGHSLPAQLTRLREYAVRHGFKVIKEFAFQETGGEKKQRKKFDGMLGFLSQHKPENMPALLCMNVDRITRNFRDAVAIDELRIQKNLHVHFVQDGFSISPASTGSDMFQWEAKVFIAKQYINRVRDDAVRSREHKTKNGEWCSRAPLGYLNKRDAQGRAYVTLDPDRAPLVRRMFVEYAKGVSSFKTLAGMANNWGLRNVSGSKLSTSQADYIIKNPFYYGVMIEQGEAMPHKYPTLIDKATWDKCQQVRMGWEKKPFAYSEKSFAFKGQLTCKHCGSMYVSETKKGKYTYLFCTKNKDENCPAPRVKEETLFAQVEAMLERISIPEDVLTEVRKQLAVSHADKNEYHNAAVASLRKQLTTIEKNIQKLWGLYLSAEEGSLSITKDELDKKMLELKNEEASLKASLANHQNADQDFYVSVNLLLELVKDAAKLFRASTAEQKRKLLALLYWNLQLDMGRLCFSLRKPFELFAQEPKQKVWL